MAGFAGVIGLKRSKEAETLVDEMLQAMSHEPFYKTGKYINDELGLCVGWVVHPDSFSDCMPVRSNDGNTTIILSGEIFTSDERSQVLRSSGHNVTACNGSYLGQLSEDINDKMFEELNGTFCGILADSRRKTLQLFNDRMGFEKLYFAEGNSGELFYFATESKAILKVVPQTRHFDPQGLAQFLNYGSTMAETTLYEGISLLPPASVWEFAPNHSVRKRTYFRPTDWQSDPAIGPAAFQMRFNEIFKRILPPYFGGSVQPGISLTGGWDTRMIMACHRAKPASLPCYTFAGETGDTVDVHQARKVAKLLGQEHVTLRLQPDFLTDFAKHAERTVYISDGNGDVCLSHEIYLNRLARQVTGVRVTGNFGSEVLRGISTFKELPSRSAWANGDLKTEIWRCREQWNTGKGEMDETSFAVFREIPWKLSPTFRLANSQLPTRAPFLDNELLKLACTTPLSVRRDSGFPVSLIRSECPELLGVATDRGEAGNSSALARTFRRGFYAGTFKLDYMLNEGMPNFFPIVFDLPPLHRALTFGHKYLEYRRWFRGPLRGYAEESLNNGNSFVSSLIGKKAVERALAEHVGGIKNQLEQINVWLTLELINKRLLQMP
jgi:asparagine synthase (glutamine-hydrolysing)